MSSNVVIQTSTVLPAYELQVELTDVVYTLYFRWNQRAEMWMMDLKDADGNIIVAGRRCCINLSLLDQFIYGNTPRGVLVVYDTSLRDLDPRLNDFGSRVQLFFLGLPLAA